MKNNNNIDKLFESKLSNQSFELKDSYIADFESKLDVYNKKGKGYFWLVFATVASITIGIVYDFIILPNYYTNTIKTEQVTKETSNKTTIKTTSKSKVTETEVNNTTINHNVNSTSIKPTNSIIPTNQKATNSSSTPKKDRNSAGNITKSNKSVPQTDRYIKGAIDSNEENKSESTNFITETKNQDTDKVLDKQVNIFSDSVFTPEPVADVYIDDTIRRQVIIIDTVVKKDTIIITDTIKRKFRVFKKKI